MRSLPCFCWDPVKERVSWGASVCTRLLIDADNQMKSDGKHWPRRQEECKFGSSRRGKEGTLPETFRILIKEQSYCNQDNTYEIVNQGFLLFLASQVSLLQEPQWGKDRYCQGKEEDPGQGKLAGWRKRRQQEASTLLLRGWQRKAWLWLVGVPLSAVVWGQDSSPKSPGHVQMHRLADGAAWHRRSLQCWEWQTPDLEVSWVYHL